MYWRVTHVSSYTSSRLKQHTVAETSMLRHISAFVTQETLKCGPKNFQPSHNPLSCTVITVVSSLHSMKGPVPRVWYSKVQNHAPQHTCHRLIYQLCSDHPTDLSAVSSQPYYTDSPGLYEYYRRTTLTRNTLCNTCKTILYIHTSIHARRPTSATKRHTILSSLC